MVACFRLVAMMMVRHASFLYVTLLSWKHDLLTPHGNNVMRCISGALLSQSRGCGERETTRSWAGKYINKPSSNVKSSKVTHQLQSSSLLISTRAGEYQQHPNGNIKYTV